jgi:transcriptional regulator with XRE-family HTH domain
LKLPRLKAVRELHGWSQTKLAEESGVSRDSISNYETGQREAYPGTAKKLADALDVEIADLIEPARELAHPLAEAPGEAGLRHIPENLDRLLEQRGVPTRHLANENLYNTLQRASLEETVRIAEEMYAEIEAVGPDLTRMRDQFLHNPRAARLLKDAVMRYWIVRLSLAVKRGQELEPAVPEVDEAIRHLQEQESILVGVS